jgi:pre-mRNA-processing factor 40
MLTLRVDHLRPSETQLIFKDLLERAKEKEEKENKKRKRLEEDFVEALRSTRVRNSKTLKF